MCATLRHVTGSRRQGALLLWISCALVSAALTWLGLVGFGLLLSRPGRGTREDWLISGGAFAVGLLALLGSLAMGRRALRSRR
jgi:arginine exporter protein ArgO